MTWEQWVVAAVLLWNLVSGTAKFAGNRDLDTTTATIGVLLVLAVQVGFAVVLHAGGFW